MEINEEKDTKSISFNTVSSVSIVVSSTGDVIPQKASSKNGENRSDENDINELVDAVDDSSGIIDINKEKYEGSISPSKYREFWDMKRKKQRMKEKDRKFRKKQQYSTKEEYIESDYYQQLLRNRESKERWNQMKLEEIPFQHPRVCVDLSYEDELTDKEMRSLINQLGRLYGTLRYADRPLHITFTGVKGIWLKMLERVDFRCWKLFSTPDSVFSLHSNNFSNLIYLSPESPNIIYSLNVDKIYIIGGIVDHNRLKGLSYKRAQTYGIETARLPVSEILQCANTSLNINHVFSILMDLANDNKLHATLVKHVPTRRSFQKKNECRKRKRKGNVNSSGNGNTERNVNFEAVGGNIVRENDGDKEIAGVNFRTIETDTKE